MIISLNSSKHKYNSGTGWPSFYQPAVEGNVASDIDRKYGMTRTEVHCAKVCIFKNPYSASLIVYELYFSARRIWVMSSMMDLNLLTCVIVSMEWLCSFILIKRKRNNRRFFFNYIYLFGSNKNLS